MIARSQLWFFPMVGQKFQAKNAWKINVPTVVLLQRQHCERKGNFQSEAIFGVETNASIHGSSSLLGTRNTEARQECLQFLELRRLHRLLPYFQHAEGGVRFQVIAAVNVQVAVARTAMQAYLFPALQSMPAATSKVSPTHRENCRPNMSDSQSLNRFCIM